MLSSCGRTSLVTAVVLLTFAISSAPAVAQSSARAGVSLTGADATLTQGSSTPWTLEKSGSVDSTSRTVTWSISAIEGIKTQGELAVRGQISVTNTGVAGATIGNLVVNLQTRSGATWRTRSSDVADATSDDAATRAVVVPSASSENAGSFTENGASGALLFTDTTTNSLFALSPKVTIAPGATVALRFVANFDNSVLRLRTGESIRAEVIVSFGNSGPSGASAPRLDIDGSGVIDPDESYVRSVPARLGLTVPAGTAPQTPVLTDTLADVATTGTVSLSNPVFNLGPTTGTVMVSYVPGTVGGAITNCAHLRTTDGSIDLQACDTRIIAPAPACTPGTVGCGWKSGDVITYSQDLWGTLNTIAASLLADNFFTVFPAGGVEIGLSGAAGNSAFFSSAEAVLDYLSTTGFPDALDADLLDPMSTSAGVFAGYVLALQLDVSFSDAGLLGGSSALRFSDLRLCGLTDTPLLNDLTVGGVLAVLNAALGGGNASYSYELLAALAERLTQSFEGGAPSTFAQQHIVNGMCPAGPPTVNPGGYSQDSWGGDPATSAAAALVLAQFDGRYPGGLEVGISGSAGVSMIFTSGPALLDYLPGTGTPGPLTADLVDPTSTTSGAFGGQVVALKLNVDFSDAGLLAAAGVPTLGDFRLCGLPITPAYNNLTVRQFLSEMNKALGGGPVPYTFDELWFLTEQITGAYQGATPSAFAQQHLVNGSCPSGWQNGDLVTYNQENWGLLNTTAANLLLARFFGVYSNGVGVEIGTLGVAGNSAIFDSPEAVFDFLPAVGDPSYLDNDLLNPASTSAGTLAGYVLALQLNVSFADAGLLGGSSVLRFHALRLCGVSSAPLLNNLTVREALAAANRVLGGFTTPDDYEQFATAVAQLTNSFESGVPSPFAQQHLRNGSCPVVWQPGDLVTYNQQNWGSINTAASALLVNYFESLSPNGVEIGVVGNAGNSALFTTVDAVLEALPTSGTAGPFINDLVDPDFSQGGTLAGYALALHFNVTYSDAHLLGANSTLRLGDLRVCGVSDIPQFNNLTVRQVLAFANQVLGFVITLNDNDYEPIALFVERLTESFESGTVSVFAQRHLVNGICASGWSSGTVITYDEESWGTPGTTAATLLGNEFDSVYIGGAVEIGVPGAGTSAVFTTSDAVLAYLPADGVPAPLSHDLANPTSTSSGVFGGFVLALQLAVDFADAGHLARTSGVRVGDLTVCSLTDTPLLNGLTVRQVLAIANQVLGGSSSPNDFDHLSDLVQALSRSFESGIPNSFAQQHLVGGACPS